MRLEGHVTVTLTNSRNQSNGRLIEVESYL